jgi:adenosylhomocysteinase
LKKVSGLPREYEVKNIKMAEEGRSLVSWAESRMPVLMKIKERFQREKPLKGIRIGATLHVTKETAVLIKTLKAAGADVALSGSNPLSTQDKVAAALAEEGVHVYAWRGQSNEDYYRCIKSVINHGPDIVHDDGADTICALHENASKQVKKIIVALEETTTGVIRLKAMEKKGDLLFPIIAVNDAKTKRLFDNRYGTGQSTIEAIVRSTSVLLAGKTFVVVGYGWCSRGIAMRARGMGANVIVTEVDPIKALEAAMDGFAVKKMDDASEVGDIFVTATGSINTVRGEHLKQMKDGVILANSGHFNVEISIPDLKALSKNKTTIRPNVEQYTLKNGRKIYLLGEGRLVNLTCAEGHPPDVMDMSFANQALCAEYSVNHKGELKSKVYNVPDEIDLMVATLKLGAMGINIDTSTEEQQKYLEGWRIGT